MGTKYKPGKYVVKIKYQDGESEYVETSLVVMDKGFNETDMLAKWYDYDDINDRSVWDGDRLVCIHDVMPVEPDHYEVLWRYV